MNKIAILYICTGKYSALWREFYESFEERFLTECKKEYFVFTDSPTLEYVGDHSKIHLIPQEALAWPYATLLRFHMFNRIAVDLTGFDYIFFFNANAFAVGKITQEMILPQGKDDLSLVRHPAYRNDKPFQFPYDRNFKCNACIPYGLGRVYVQGCLIGGTAQAFLHMSQTIANQIDEDLKRNVIALWHDESYLNKYILKHKNFRLLGIEFANPLSSDPEFCIIRMRQKDQYFSVEEVKMAPPSTKLSKYNQFLNDRIYGFLSRKAIFRSDCSIMAEQGGKLKAFAWGLKNCWKVFLGKR